MRSSGAVNKRDAALQMIVSSTTYQYRCASVPKRDTSSSAVDTDRAAVVSTYIMFELFQYTACRLLPLDRCKFVSVSVMRLRESVARAIIPSVLVQPKKGSVLSFPNDLSITTSQWSTTP